MNTFKALIIAAILLTASAAHATRTGIDIMVINPASTQPSIAAYDNDTRQWVMQFGDCLIKIQCLYNGYSSSGVEPAGDYEHDDWVLMADRSLVYYAKERHGATFNDDEIGSPFLWEGASVGHFFNYCVVDVDSGCAAPFATPEVSALWLILMGVALMGLSRYVAVVINFFSRGGIMFGSK